MKSLFGSDGACTVLRTKKKWSRSELASRAGVSIKVVSYIEENKYIDINDFDVTSHNKRAKSRGIAQVAIALGEDPERWIDSLADERKDYRLDINQRAEVLEGARSRVRRSLGSGERDYGVTIMQELNRQDTLTITVPVGFRNYQENKNFHEFLVELTRRTFRLLHNGLYPEDEAIEKSTDFESLFNNLSKPDNPFRLIVGPPRVPSRTFRFPLEFIDIPGLSMRLVALVRDDSTLRWDEIAAGPGDNMTGGHPLRFLAFKGGVSHIYLKNYLGYSDDNIRLVSKWGKDDIESYCEKFLSVESSISSRTAVVIDEYAAIRLRRDSRMNPGSFQLKVLSGMSSPTFPLALATRRADEKWMMMIEQALDELFTRLPHQMASLYFKRLLKPFIDELLINNNYEDDGFRQFAYKNTKDFPSYIHVFNSKSLSPDFWSAIGKMVDDLIRDPVYAKAINDARASADGLRQIFLSMGRQDNL